MLDDVTLALLGDRDAQERITARGELLPCPFCGSEEVESELVCGEYFVRCNACNASSGFEETTEECVRNWNTRAPMGAAALRQADGLAVMLGLMIRTFSEGYRTDAQRIALEAAKESLREYDLQNLFGERI